MHDGNLIVPDKIINHIHRYASPHFNPHGDHLHHWNHEPGGHEGTKTIYGPGYIDELSMYDILNNWTLIILSEISFNVFTYLKVSINFVFIILENVSRPK